MFFSVQYLRAIAAFMVVLSHTAFKLEVHSNNFLSWFHIGAYGVDLFFIISGFIMCLCVENKKITFSRFMFARAQRILPLYWVLTFLALLIYLYQPSLINSSGGETNIFSSFSLIPMGEKLLIQNGWTLSFEFLFYIVFAVSVVLTSKYKMLASLLLMSLSVIGLFINFKQPFIIFCTSPFLIEFVLGILAYNIIQKKVLNIWGAISLIFLAFVLLLIVNQNGGIIDGFNRTLYAGIPMFIFFIGVVCLENMLPKNKILLSIGMSSYSLYLVHPFILAGVTLFSKKTGLIDYEYIYAFMMVISSLIGGWLCYLFIEQKIDRKLKSFTNWYLLNRTSLSRNKLT